MKYPFNKDFRKIAFKLPFSKLICSLSQMPLEIIIKFIHPPKNLTVKDFYINGFENQKILVKEISPQRNKRNIPRLRHAKQPPDFKRQRRKTHCLYEKMDGLKILFFFIIS